MDKKKSRDPKDTIAFVKEWVSDNLRYILLAAAIIIIVLIIIFALSSSPIKKADSSTSGQTSTVNETGVTNENGLATEDKTTAQTNDQTAAASDDKSASASSAATAEETSAASAENNTGDANAASNATPAAVNANASQQSADGSQLTVAAPEIAATVETYLSALAASDVDSAASVSENLTEAEIGAITAGAYPSPIERIVTYAYPGTEEGTYIAIVRFDATDRATLVSVPACSAYYIITADTGAVLMASADTTAAHQAEIDTVLGYPAVQQLIADVANAAQAVVANTAQ